MKNLFVGAIRLFIFTAISYTLLSIGNAVQSVIPELHDAYIAVVVGVAVTAGYQLLEG